MGIEKSEIKMGVAHDIGCRLEDALEAAKQDVYRWEGAKMAYTQATKDVNGLLGHLKRDVEEQKLSMDQGILVQRWLTRSRDVCQNLTLQADAMICKVKGKVEAMEKAVKITKGVYDVEEKKRDSLKVEQKKLDAADAASVSAEDSSGPKRISRPTGLRPDLSEAQQRRKGINGAAAHEPSDNGGSAKELKPEPEPKPAPKKSKAKTRKRKKKEEPKKEVPKQEPSPKKEQKKSGPRSPHLPPTGD